MDAVSYEPAGGDSSGLVRVRLDVAYDGTDFAGWAAQPEQRTVAGVLTEVLTRLFGTPSGLTVAGRTDAGVHASGQVCHVDLPAPGWTELAPTVVKRLAGMLPGDVRVTAANQVPAAFDARFSAVRRRYAYRVSDTPWGVDPLRRRDTLGWPWPLDVSRLNAAAADLLGEHDFAAYCRRKEHGTTIRTLQRFEWRRDTDGIVVAVVEADAFCQAMVRSLVGGLLPVGDGRRPVEWPASLLTRRQRASEVVVAPPHGLILTGVDYPEPGAYAARAALARNRRA
ncbi:MAG: tRNA pseudouridine(38-40) synthase TruA [Micromonosporaceae bacterium]